MPITEVYAGGMGRLWDAGHARNKRENLCQSVAQVAERFLAWVEDVEMLMSKK